MSLFSKRQWIFISFVFIYFLNWNTCLSSESRIDLLDVDDFMPTLQYSCNAGKEISPCTCQQLVSEPTVKVTCQKMSSFAEIVQILKNKIEKNNQVKLTIELSNLEDLNNTRFSNIHDGITTIQFRQNKMKLNSSLEGIDKVTKLALVDTTMNEFPKTIFKHMPNLKAVTIQKSNLNSIFASDFESLKNLTVLAIIKCNLSKIESNAFPPTIKNVQLSMNNLTSLNGSFRNNEQLRFVIIKMNNLESLEGQFSDSLPNLFYLDAGNNKLIKLPSTISNYKRLGWLLVNNNSIISLDEVFRNFCALMLADFSANNINYLSPNEFKKCFQLSTLNLTNNKLTHLNKSMLPLNSLENLDLSYNSFEEFSIVELAGLKNLVHVNLTGNKLRKFIGFEQFYNVSVTSLDELHLQFNELVELEGFLSGMNLKKLNLSHNKLSSIPKTFISGLYMLDQLDVSYNNLLTISNIFKMNMPALRVLNMDSNKLTILDHLAEYEKSAICILYVRNNNIYDIYADFLENNQCIDKINANEHVNGTTLLYLNGNNNLMCGDQLTNTTMKNNIQIISDCQKNTMIDDPNKYTILNNTESNIVVIPYQQNQMKIN